MVQGIWYKAYGTGHMVQGKWYRAYTVQVDGTCKLALIIFLGLLLQASRKITLQCIAVQGMGTIAWVRYR